MSFYFSASREYRTAFIPGECHKAFIPLILISGRYVYSSMSLPESLAPAGRPVGNVQYSLSESDLQDRIREYARFCIFS